MNLFSTYPTLPIQYITLKFSVSKMSAKQYQAYFTPRSKDCYFQDFLLIHQGNKTKQELQEYATIAATCP